MILGWFEGPRLEIMKWLRTDRQTNKQTNRISTCRLDPSGRRGRVKKALKGWYSGLQCPPVHAILFSCSTCWSLKHWQTILMRKAQWRNNRSTIVGRRAALWRLFSWSDFLHKWLLAVRAIWYPYSLLFSQNRSSSVLYKETFSRGILLSAPDRQPAQYLVRQLRKIQLICKRKAKRCGAKPTLGRTTK